MGLFAAVVRLLSMPLVLPILVVRTAWQTCVWFEKRAHRWCDEQEKDGAP
jgi:hypothetical protein